VFGLGKALNMWDWCGCGRMVVTCCHNYRYIRCPSRCVFSGIPLTNTLGHDGCTSPHISIWKGLTRIHSTYEGRLSRSELFMRTAFLRLCPQPECAPTLMCRAPLSIDFRDNLLRTGPGRRDLTNRITVGRWSCAQRANPRSRSYLKIYLRI
jgi:hypothetical protein